MPVLPKKSVLVDTSFLISVFDDSRKNHVNAKQYYEYFIENNIDMYLSSIVVSEYSMKGNIEDIIATENFIFANFSAIDGIVAGDFSNSLFYENDRSNGFSRDAVKADVMLLAQCSNNEIDYIATDDGSTLAKYGRRLRRLGKLKSQVITLDGFDPSIFKEGQMSLDLRLSNNQEPTTQSSPH